jgi:hypothetical protein
MENKKKKETGGARPENLWREHRKPHMAHEFSNYG